MLDLLLRLLCDALLASRARERLRSVWSFAGCVLLDKQFLGAIRQVRTWNELVHKYLAAVLLCFLARRKFLTEEWWSLHLVFLHTFILIKKWCLVGSFGDLWSSCFFGFNAVQISLQFLFHLIDVRSWHRAWQLLHLWCYLRKCQQMSWVDRRACNVLIYWRWLLGVRLLLESGCPFMLLLFSVHWNYCFIN